MAVSHTTARPRPPQSAPQTLWEEGRRPGRQVAALAGAAVLLVAAVNLVLTDRLSLFFDLCFVVVCLAAGLAVHPRDFFLVGVLPPLLMLLAVTAVAAVDRAAVADEVDSIVQAVVSGLAHHAGALLAGYAAALVILALRQVALRASRPGG